MLTMTSKMMTTSKRMLMRTRRQKDFYVAQKHSKEDREDQNKSKFNYCKILQNIMLPSSVAEPEPPGAALFPWSRSRSCPERAAPAPAQSP